MEADAGELVEAGLLGAEATGAARGASSGSSSMRSISSLALRKTASAGATSSRSDACSVGVGELVLVEVEDVDERLGRQQAQLLRLGEVDPGGRPGGIQGVALLEDLLRGERRCRAAAFVVLLDPRLLLEARDGLLEGLEVGEDQLGVDRLDVGSAG